MAFWAISSSISSTARPAWGAAIGLSLRGYQPGWLHHDLVAGLVLISYWRESAHDIGLTGEMALVLTLLLGALACEQAVVAVGLAVLSAGVALVAVRAQSNVTSATLIQVAGGTGSDG